MQQYITPRTVTFIANKSLNLFSIFSLDALSVFVKMFLLIMLQYGYNCRTYERKNDIDKMLFGTVELETTFLK